MQDSTIITEILIELNMQDLTIITQILIEFYIFVRKNIKRIHLASNNNKLKIYIHKLIFKDIYTNNLLL